MNQNLIMKKKKIKNVEIILSRIINVFTLTRINKRHVAYREKIIYKNTHVIIINKNLIRVNSIFQLYIIFFFINIFILELKKEKREASDVITLIMRIIIFSLIKHFFKIISYIY